MLLQKRQGIKLWMGNETGLWRIGTNKLEPVYRDSIQGIVREILSDEKGNLYIGSGDGYGCGKQMKNWNG